MRLIAVLLLAFVLAGCQLIPVKTIGKTDEELAEEAKVVITPAVSLAAEEKIELGGGKSYSQPVAVEAGKAVVFKNVSQQVIRLVLILDREIVQELDPKEEFGFVYPGGFERVEFSWNGGRGVLARR